MTIGNVYFEPFAYMDYSIIIVTSTPFGLVCRQGEWTMGYIQLLSRELK